MGKSHLCAFIVLGILALVSVVSAELPATVDAVVAGPGTDSYVDVTILSGGNSELTLGLHPGWYNAPVEMLGNEPQTFSVYSSLDSNPTSISAKNWNKINYILNNKDGANAATIQAAISFYDGKESTRPDASIDQEKLSALKAAADENADSFILDPSDIYAVILWDQESAQAIIVEVPAQSVPVPEFPTLALPVAMMLGVVFTVHVVKGRERAI